MLEPELYSPHTIVLGQIMAGCITSISSYQIHVGNLSLDARGQFIFTSVELCNHPRTNLSLDMMLNTACRKMYHIQLSANSKEIIVSLNCLVCLSMPNTEYDYFTELHIKLVGLQT